MKKLLEKKERRKNKKEWKRTEDLKKLKIKDQLKKKLLDKQNKKFWINNKKTNNNNYNHDIKLNNLIIYVRIIRKYSSSLKIVLSLRKFS